MSRRESWNDRYAASELVWGAEPNRSLVATLAAVEPHGRALDLACGEGRNAIWLALQGWRVTAVDFSGVAIERAHRLAKDAGASIEFVCEDATAYAPEPAAYALVVILYMQVPSEERRRALVRAHSAMADGAELMMIGHALDNLDEGVGGPQDPAVLWQPEEIATELAELGLEVESTELLRRPVEDKGVAIDAMIRAHAPQRS